MSSPRSTRASTATSSALTADQLDERLEGLSSILRAADAVVVGAGSGLSAAAGITYQGPRFEKLFGDFITAFGLTDMYSAGFHRFPSPEHRWAYWSRHVLANRYDQPPLPIYQQLADLLAGTTHFVITTNVDHAFANNGIDKDRLFAVQGDYGLFQCSVPCRQETWSNESAIRAMVAQQSDLRIASALLPTCPWCGHPAAMNLRADSTFVQDAAWHAASGRYAEFLHHHATGRVLYFELGVGYNTPGIIKYPFWRRTLNNPDATYAILNEAASAPADLATQTIALPGDIAASLRHLTGEKPLRTSES